jgi:hypothetical protein
MASDISQLIRKVSRLPGWEVRLRKAGHYVAMSPDGGQCFLPATPSDTRGLYNARAKLRRLGADI